MPVHFEDYSSFVGTDFSHIFAASLGGGGGGGRGGCKCPLFTLSM